ncbi:MAG: hypothetical protein ABR861_00435 [Terriglobales bacterium]|jgi:hypothetical protein
MSSGSVPHVPPIPPHILSIRQTYAWQWFSYNASQRMTSLRYFFVTLGIFAVAYSKCVENKWHGLGCLVGILGAIASVAFWFLDVRNEELVNCGRVALDEIEKELHLTVRCDDHERSRLTESTGWLPGTILGILKIIFPEKTRMPLWLMEGANSGSATCLRIASGSAFSNSEQ